MGQMKNLYLEQLDAGDLDQPETITIYVMTMGGKPCNAYMDKAEADYEAWLCNQADAHNEDGEVNLFAVTEVQLLT
jgi:hypothetical protein